jgi:hypothetical protein
MKLSPGADPRTSLFLTVYFSAVAALTWFGRSTVRTSKRYYRAARQTLTLVERELGLFKPIEGLNDPEKHLGIAVTPGQRDYRSVILENKRHCPVLHGRGRSSHMFRSFSDCSSS